MVQKKGELNESESLPSPTGTYSFKSGKSLLTRGDDSNKDLHSVPSSQKIYSVSTAHESKEAKMRDPNAVIAGGPPVTAAVSANITHGIASYPTSGSNATSIIDSSVHGTNVGHLKLKRAISHSIDRPHHSSTLCTTGSSYVYHCPSNLARKNNQNHRQRSRQSSLSSIHSNFITPYWETDASSDETQSMVEIGHKPSRAPAPHVISIGMERGGNENSHIYMQNMQYTTDRTQPVKGDNSKHSNHQV